MADKVFGIDFTDTTNPIGTETTSINDGTVLKDVTLRDFISKVGANATEKTALVDADNLMVIDSASAPVNGLKRGTLASLKTMLKTYFDTLYSGISTITHATRHKWLGADPVDIRELLLINCYPSVFKNWSDINGFTASHAGTGVFTLGFVQGTPATGATINSRVCLYSNASIALIGTSGFLANVRTKVNPSTVTTNCTMWLGVMTNPTAPTATEHHAAFKIAEGVIYASCGNGTTGNLTSTGVTIGQYGVADLYMKEKVGSIEYYVNGTLTNTFTTNLPNSGSVPKLTFYMTNTTGADRSIALFPYWFLQATT